MTCRFPTCKRGDLPIDASGAKIYGANKEEWLTGKATTCSETRFQLVPSMSARVYAAKQIVSELNKDDLLRARLASRATQAGQFFLERAFAFVFMPAALR